MTNTVDFYLDKGTDFDGVVQITGINNLPVCLEDWDFECRASNARDPRKTINIDVLTDPIRKGLVVITIPHKITASIDSGTWVYKLVMFYKDYDIATTKRLEVARGKIIVNDSYQAIW